MAQRSHPHGGALAEGPAWIGAGGKRRQSNQPRRYGRVLLRPVTALPKQPKAKFLLQPSKTPKAAVSPDSLLYQHPSWRVRSLEIAGPFGWHEISGEKLREIGKKPGDFESLTWQEIRIRDKDKNHAIPVADLTIEAQDRLAEIGQDDVDEIFSLRLSAKERIFGILDESVMRVLWWGPDHRVCPSPKGTPKKRFSAVDPKLFGNVTPCEIYSSGTRLPAPPASVFS